METSVRYFFHAFFSILLFCANAVIHAAPGDLDPTFGTGGKVTTAIGSLDDSAYSVAVQSDGKIVTAGMARNGGRSDIAVVRYNADGSLDTAFGSTGKVTVSLSSGDDVALSLALQADGKIIVAGYATNSTRDVALVRFNANGSLDTSFNGTGKVVTTVGTGSDTGRCVVVQSDGKIVVAGDALIGSAADIVVLRYNANGSLDTSFNGTGKVTTAIGIGNDSAYSVALQTDGKIVVAGDSFNGSDYDFALVRYHADGSLDTTFNSTGKVITAIGTGDDDAFSVAIDANGKIVVAGGASSGGAYSFAVARYTTTGALDTSFGGTGKVSTSISGIDELARTMAVQSNGKIVLGGYSNNGSNQVFALARYQPDGSLDTSFGVGADGKVATTIGAHDAFAYAVAVQADGRIVLAGSANNGSDNDFAFVRYEGGPFDTATEAPTLAAPVSGAAISGPVAVSFTLPEAALTGSVKLSFGATVLTLAASQESAGAHSFTFNPAAPTESPRIASGSAIANGTYTVTLSYQDALGNPAASVFASNVSLTNEPFLLTQVRVDARAAIFGAGYAGTLGGLAPVSIALPPGTGRRLVVPDVYGHTYPATAFFPGDTFYPADGGNLNNSSTTVLEYGGISGIVDDPSHKLALLGVFTSGTVPNGTPAPAALSFAGNHDFATLSPQDRQVFFIGDGHGAAGLHVIDVPDGATTLYLGFADSSNTTTGTPGNFSDNRGSLDVAVQILASAGQPAPQSLELSVVDFANPQPVVRPLDQNGLPNRVEFTIKRTHGVRGAVTVDVLAKDVGTPGAVTAGIKSYTYSQEYDVAPEVSSRVARVGFADGQTSATVTVQFSVLATARGTFELELVNATGGATLGFDAKATVSVLAKDTSRPAVSVAGLGSVVTGPFDIVGTVRENDGLRSFVVKVNGVVWTLNTDPLGNFSANAALGYGVLGVSPENGPNLIVIEARDMSGNTTTLSKTVTYVNPGVAGRAGTYSALLKPTGTPDVNTSGLVTVTVGTTGSFSGSAMLGGVKVSFSGVLRNDGSARFKPALGTTVDLIDRTEFDSYLGALALSVNSSTGLSGSLFTDATGTTELAIFSGQRESYSKTQLVPATPFLNQPAGPSPTKGVYSIVFPEPTAGAPSIPTPPPVGPGNPGVSSVPAGAGYLSLTLLNNGGVTWLGLLADGIKLTGAAKLRADGTAAFFVPLYKKQGAILGDVHFADSAATDATIPDCLWLRPALPRARYYPEGWPQGLVTDAYGTKYNPPASFDFGQGNIDSILGNSVLTFSGAGLPGPLPIAVNVTTLGKVTTLPTRGATYSLSVVPGTGILTGTFRHADGSSVPYRGILLDKTTNQGGIGFFLSTPGLSVSAPGQSGMFTLAPR